MPAGSIAAPDVRTRICAPPPVDSPSTTSSTSTSNELIAVPLTTDSPVHCIPARTWLKGMIGSAAAAGAAGRRRAGSTAARIRRRMCG